MPMIVKGCAHPHLRSWVNGVYEERGENHGFPMYKSIAEDKPSFIYYWDERNGPQFQGWWIGPEVGCADYFAYNATVVRFPPHVGWYVGPVIDETMEISVLPTPPPLPVTARIRSCRTDGTQRSRTKKKIVYDDSHPLAIKRKRDNANRTC